MELEPNYMPTHFVLGCVYIQQKRLEEAIKEFQLFTNSMKKHISQWASWVTPTRLPVSERKPKRCSTCCRRSPYENMFHLTRCFVIHLVLGPEERVFELLEVLYQEHNDWLVWLKVSPELKHLHDDSRFNNLMKHVGFID